MMPWEHAIVGYISYSRYVHAVYREAPTSTETIVVVFASVLPDLIDKPLAWEFGVFSSGRALAHSIFFAIPVSIIVGWIASSRGRLRLGWAFVLGYLLHLLADVVTGYMLRGEIQLNHILWPVRRDEREYEAGFQGEFRDSIVEYVLWVTDQLTSGDPDPHLFVILGSGGFGVLRWICDGMPVGREIYHTIRRAMRVVVRAVKRN